ncbi:LysR family transcriptional regulator [Nocardioides sp. GY 10113]|uniref:LysR family transcriptional regulator n=1 Tax=Nocardioides sp. GY 10113 TaxID=2569761 RepID=UPI0010A908AA|nr:LysR substrate-binding domain-containing protein [Nocardioides sp. GY 10113]TIC88869.1 LysR family transcriptional regulator [Nocardioides sp. GY 10113]
MELRQLRYFVAVAEELHFGRAAARLLIASPSLSQQIKALERSLAVTLFERSSTGVALTPAGAQLLPLARSALAAAEEVRSTAQRISQERAEVLRLGFLPFSLTGASRRLLTEFGRAAPTVTVQLRQYEWDDPSAGLLAGDTDAALVRPPFTGAERLTLLELATDPLLAIVAEDHPLAAEGSVTRTRLAAEPWLEAAGVTDPVFAAFWYFRDVRRHGPAVRSEAATLEEWLSEIAFGRGVNVVPASLAEEYRRPGLAFVPLADTPRSPLALAWPRDRPTPAVQALARAAAGAGRPGG